MYVMVGKMSAVFRRICAQFAVVLVFSVGATAAAAQSVSFKVAVAEAASGHEDIAEFYRARDYAGIWVGSDTDAIARRNALFAAFDAAEKHGLPASRFDANALEELILSGRSNHQLGLVDVRLTRAFLDYGHAVQSGLVEPAAVDDNIKRRVNRDHDRVLLSGLLGPDPFSFIRELAPSTPEYARLLREKSRLEQVLADGGWGPTIQGSDTLRPGDTGPRVIALRDRLIAMGYMPNSVGRSYDAALQSAVVAFQESHGLLADGIAGSSTVSEVNVDVEQRLKSIVVALERERWMNRDRGERHIWVNLADFSATIVDHGEVTFRTRSVIGANTSDRQSPEFSDRMDYMVINPSWYVPRSIIVGEYLPQLQADPTSASYINLIDESGNVIDRAGVDFTQFTASTFPFGMKQPPSNSNALGLVKFMFPNRYNIYLHDTPAKSLFGREVRAFSHGCIRLNDPFDFAYALLAKQTADPVDYFHSILETGQETQVNLETPLPVHLAYRTAFTHTDGELQFRRDVYGRDAKIWAALAALGVEIGAVNG